MFGVDKTSLEIAIVPPQAQNKDEFAHTALKAASDAFQAKYSFIRVRLYEDKSDLASFKSLLANLNYTRGELIDLSVRESRSLKHQAAVYMQKYPVR